MNMNEETFWNGETCLARKVIVRVGHAMAPTWWCADLEGQERRAVEIVYHKDPFYIDDADGRGWRKVTKGHGSPHWPHSSLPNDSQVLREV